MNKAHVFLGVFKVGADPHVVTQLLGIEPSHVITPGELMPGKAGERGQRWSHGRSVLSSPAGKTADIEDQLTALLPLLEQRRDAISAADQQFEVGLMCAAYFRETNPGFRLDADLLARIVALWLDVDFDLYFMEGPVEDADPAPANVDLLLTRGSIGLCSANSGDGLSCRNCDLDGRAA